MGASHASGLQVARDCPYMQPHCDQQEEDSLFYIWALIMSEQVPCQV